MERINIIYGNIITPNGIIKSGQVIIEEGKIAAINNKPVKVNNAQEINAMGKFVSPGFIDIHIHGGGGHDFMDGTEQAFLAIAKLHAKYGTTAMLPTTLSGSREELVQTLESYQKAVVSNTHGAQFLGMHLEGPYFAMSQRGAQDPKYIRNPDPAEYEQIVTTYPFITRWSAAPELPGALAFADYMMAHNVLPAFAHTDAVCEEVEQGFAHGYSLATHLYSGMAGVTRRNAYRYAGAVEASFLIDEIDVEIIADGVHLPAPLLKLIYKIKGADRIALITDAMRAAGMPEGESVLGSLHNGLKVIVENGVAKLPDRTAFAGSVATADRLVRTMRDIAGIALPDVIKMMCYTPARILGVHSHKGSLEVGKDADIVLFDNDITIANTIIGGRVVYNAD
ncbi:MAG: N-acetylglucosamine-6-phosphate deacetylase [Chitinophagaceae bacterium]|nr:N-acetylglucosamine-6-phosphate deacetylase [Chitinophagaceae bacterium]